MALIACPDCRRELSNQAKACPHCGRLTPNSALYYLTTKTVVIGIAVCSFLALIAWNGYKANQRTAADDLLYRERSLKGMDEISLLEAAAAELRFRSMPLHQPEQSIDLGDRRIIVHRIEWYLDRNLEEPFGTDQALAFRVSIHNTGKSTIEFSPFDFSIETEDRRLLGHAVDFRSDKQPQPLLHSGVIKPGDWLEGYLTYVAGKKPVVIYYEEFLTKRPLAAIAVN